MGPLDSLNKSIAAYTKGQSSNRKDRGSPLGSVLIHRIEKDGKIVGSKIVKRNVFNLIKSALFDSYKTRSNIDKIRGYIDDPNAQVPQELVTNVNTIIANFNKGKKEANKIQEISVPTPTPAPTRTPAPAQASVLLESQPIPLTPVPESAPNVSPMRASSRISEEDRRRLEEFTRSNQSFFSNIIGFVPGPDSYNFDLAKAQFENSLRALVAGLCINRGSQYGINGTYQNAFKELCLTKYDMIIETFKKAKNEPTSQAYFNAVMQLGKLCQEVHVLQQAQPGKIKNGFLGARYVEAALLGQRMLTQLGIDVNKEFPDLKALLPGGEQWNPARATATTVDGADPLKNALENVRRRINAEKGKYSSETDQHEQCQLYSTAVEKLLAE